MAAALVVLVAGTFVLLELQSDKAQQPSPSISPLVSPRPTASAPLEDFEFARIAAEGVKIRTEPAGGFVVVSTTGDLGQVVLVLGKRTVDGVEWVRVEHWKPRGSARFGWMPSIADLETPRGIQRTATLEPVLLSCETLGTTELPLMSRLPPAVRLACSGNRELRLSPVIGRDEGAEELATGKPAWLASLSGLKLYGARGWDSNDVPLDVHLDPASGLSLPTEVWLEVTGHFDDSASTTCQRTSEHPEVTVGDPVEQVLWCRQQFVITGFRDAAVPSPEPTPTAAGTIAGTWDAIADAPIQGRTGHSAVWTGSEMIVWGGEPGPATTDDTRISDGSNGSGYNPTTNSWRVIAPAPIAGRAGHGATWTDKEMLVWGGWRASDQERLADGAAYDPVNDMWRKLPPAPLSSSGGIAATWTGRELIVFDGITDAGGPITVEVASYDPEADSWSSLPKLEMPASHTVIATWTGQDLLVVANPNQGRSAGFALHPGSQWTSLPEPPFDGLNTGGVGVWTGTELLVPTSGARVAGEDRTWDQVFAYDPARERWRTSAPPPAGLRTLEPTWTGTFALFFSGAASADAYDPTRDLWFNLPPTGDRYREFAAGVWAGDRFVAWGGGEGESFLQPPDGIAFVPEARFVDVPSEDGLHPVRVEVVDASGGLVEVRAATPAELQRDAPRFSTSGVDVIQGEGARSLLIRWIGGRGDRSARLEIGANGQEMELVVVPTYGDAIGIPRGLVMAFRDQVNTAGVSVRVWNGRDG
jgi:N-acetylneuraminic acid mutarotase